MVFKGLDGHSQSPFSVRSIGRLNGPAVWRRARQSGSPEELVALLPVARAQFVGLQRIEHAQDFLGIAAHAHVVDRHETDYAFRVDDERGAKGDAFSGSIETTALRSNAGRRSPMVSMLGSLGYIG